MAIMINKQDNGKYHVRVTATHKDIYGVRRSRKKSNIPTKAVANKIAYEFQRELDEERTDNNITFAELNELYIEARQHKMSPHTLSNLKYLTPSILKELGSVKAKDINTRVVQAYMNKLAKKKSKSNSNKTINRETQKKYYNHIRAVLNWGVRYDYLEVNRVKYVELKEDDHEFEPTVLNTEQVAQVLNYLKEQFKNIYIPVLIAVTTGARRGEVLGLKWQAIDFEQQTISIELNLLQVNNKIIERTKMKTSKSKRVIPMSDFLKAELLEHKTQQEAVLTELKKMKANEQLIKNFDFVCTSIFLGRSVTPDYLTHKFKQTIKKQFGYEIRLHDLRHSFNQIGYENNIDLTTRSKMLGHASTNITRNVYTQYSMQKSRQASNAIGVAIKKAFEGNGTTNRTTKSQTNENN